MAVPGDLGAEELYERLFREVAPALWRVAYGISGGRRDVAEDAVAEAFARAIENARSIRHPVPWLYRTAIRIARHQVMADKRTSPGSPLEGKTYAEDPSGMIDLIRALRLLSPGQRAAVVLYYVEDLPVREVARLTGTSAATVRVQLHRGRRRLEKLLGASG